MISPGVMGLKFAKQFRGFPAVMLARAAEVFYFSWIPDRASFSLGLIRPSVESPAWPGKILNCATNFLRHYTGTQRMKQSHMRNRTA